MVDVHLEGETIHVILSRKRGMEPGVYFSELYAYNSSCDCIDGKYNLNYNLATNFVVVHYHIFLPENNLVTNSTNISN